ncbi:hypothetical protein EYE42_15380 [Paracoccus subflavus]|uniref:Uncharacterized protein n=1 Tax=Paracoccus subflavus TaxID=2528244 RepID=A0A4Q9FVE2_9RHOB|nr:hypothetical protein [Paracoccus subflavus]TBN36549.1 hypothetical protein EYE42_15380 [Paracoccus subflavus]
MIGVIVWSSADREKAVIWCEDHAALAYLQGRENLTNPANWPQPGDLVELDSEMAGQLRHARRVALISEREYAHLPDLLRTSTPAEPGLRLVASNPAVETRCRSHDDAEPQVAVAG